MGKKEKKRIVCPKYRVTVEFGTQRLEDCILKMLKDKEKNMKIQFYDPPE